MATACSLCLFCSFPSESGSPGTRIFSAKELQVPSPRLYLKVPLPLQGTGNPSFWRSLVEGRQRGSPINPITEARGCKGWEEGELRSLGLAGGMTQLPRPGRPGALQLPSRLRWSTPYSGVQNPDLPLAARLGLQSLEQPHPKPVYTLALRAFAAGANSYTCVRLVFWPESRDTDAIAGGGA